MMDILLMEELEKDLIPKQANLIKKRKKKISKKKNVSGNPVKPALKAFEELNPFENCHTMIRFYRGVMTSHRSAVKFYPFQSEINQSLALMDELKDMGRWENITFLRSWIAYFSTNKLRGRSISNPNRTSLKEFLSTLEEFNGKYIGP